MTPRRVNFTSVFCAVAAVGDASLSRFLNAPFFASVLAVPLLFVLDLELDGGKAPPAFERRYTRLLQQSILRDSFQFLADSRPAYPILAVC